MAGKRFSLQLPFNGSNANLSIPSPAVSPTFGRAPSPSANEVVEASGLIKVDRDGLRLQLKGLENILQHLSSYQLLLSSLAKTETALAKQAKSLLPVSSANSTGSSEVVSHALASVASLFSALGSVDEKHAKNISSELSNLSSVLDKHFRKLVKLEKTHDSHVDAADAKIKQSAAKYDKAQKSRTTTATEIGVKHEKYIGNLRTLTEEISVAKEQHLATTSHLQTEALLSTAASLSIIATNQFKASTEAVRTTAKSVGEVMRWRCLAEAAWTGVTELGSVNTLQLGEPNPVVVRARSPDASLRPSDAQPPPTLDSPTALSPPGPFPPDCPTPDSSAPSYSSVQPDSPRISSATIGGPRPAPPSAMKPSQRNFTPPEKQQLEPPNRQAWDAVPPSSSPGPSSLPPPSASPRPSHLPPPADSMIPYPIEGRSPVRPPASPRQDSSAQRYGDSSMGPPPVPRGSGLGMYDLGTDSSSPSVDRNPPPSPYALESDRYGPRTPIGSYEQQSTLGRTKRVQISDDVPEEIIRGSSREEIRSSGGRDDGRLVGRDEMRGGGRNDVRGGDLDEMRGGIRDDSRGGGRDEMRGGGSRDESRERERPRQEDYFGRGDERHDVDRERDQWEMERSRLVAEMEEQERRLAEKEREREGQRVRDLKSRLDNGSYKPLASQAPPSIGRQAASLSRRVSILSQHFDSPTPPPSSNFLSPGRSTPPMDQQGFQPRHGHSQSMSSVPRASPSSVYRPTPVRGYSSSQGGYYDLQDNVRPLAVDGRDRGGSRNDEYGAGSGSMSQSQSFGSNSTASVMANGGGRLMSDRELRQENEDRWRR